MSFDPPKLERFFNNEAVMMDYAAHKMNVRFNKELEQYGITDKQARLLMFLIINRDRAFMQKDIENTFSMRSSTITSIMQYLEQGGFILRNVCVQDARAKRITVTQKGFEMQKIIFETHERQKMLLICGLTPDEKQSLNQLLRKVIQNVDSLPR